MWRWLFSSVRELRAISNPDLLCSIETKVNRGIRSWSTCLNEVDIRKPLHRPGMVVRKLFRIAFAFALALLVTTHRIAFRICIALFALFSHFRTFSTCLVVVSWLLNKNRVKSAKNMRKSAKCECNAKKESKFASHRTNKTKKNRIFALFASHSHRTTIPGWYSETSI